MFGAWSLVAPWKAQGEGRAGRSKTLQRNSVGTQSHPGKVSHRPEASFASSSAMAARSVNSQCQSRVMEPRNKSVVGAFVVQAAGAAPERRQWQGAAVRPGSESTAQAPGVPWEHGRPVNVLETKHRKRMNRFTNILATASRLPDDVERNGGSQLEVPRFDRSRESWGRRHGSLSGFVVPRKAGERGRPEPGSREGTCTVMEPS